MKKRSKNAPILSGAAKPISLAPLTPDEALAAALQVKKCDVDKLEAKDQAEKMWVSRKKK